MSVTGVGRGVGSPMITDSTRGDGRHILGDGRYQSIGDDGNVGGEDGGFGSGRFGGMQK